MIEFKRNKKTGVVEAWKNGNLVGPIITMGDEIMDEEEKDRKKKRVKKE